MKVYYQTASKEYIEFLRDENVGNPHDWNNWGQQLYDAWNAHGKSWPEVIDSASVIVLDSITAVGPVKGKQVPVAFTLFQNFPNPFNPSTEIRWQISESRFVRLNVYDILGRQVATLVNEKQPTGTHSVTWNAGNTPSGMYFVTMTVEDKQQTRKLLLIK